MSAGIARSSFTVVSQDMQVLAYIWPMLVHLLLCNLATHLNAQILLLCVKVTIQSRPVLKYVCSVTNRYELKQQLS